MGVLTNAISGGGVSTIKVAGVLQSTLPATVSSTEDKNAIITFLRTSLAQYESKGVSIYQLSVTGEAPNYICSYVKVTSSNLKMNYNNQQLLIGTSADDLPALTMSTFGVPAWYLEANSDIASSLNVFAKEWKQSGSTNTLSVTILWDGTWTSEFAGKGPAVPNMMMGWSD